MFMIPSTPAPLPRPTSIDTTLSIPNHKALAPLHTQRAECLAAIITKHAVHPARNHRTTLRACFRNLACVGIWPPRMQCVTVDGAGFRAFEFDHQVSQEGWVPVVDVGGQELVGLLVGEQVQH